MNLGHLFPKIECIPSDFNPCNVQNMINQKQYLKVTQITFVTAAENKPSVLMI